jgi:hypothetical protein
MKRGLAVVLFLVALATSRVAAQAPAPAPLPPKTVRPGMTLAEVEQAWGKPQAVRTKGAYTYLTFPTSCLPGCGTHDIVTLQDGKVIDAIARSDGRHYDGTASFTARPPAYTPPAGAPAAPR